MPDTRFNCNASPHKMFDATACDLDELKAIRAAVPGSTINDIVLCICAGALRKYLQRHKELPAESLVAWVPINARPGVNKESDGAGNQITSMTTKIYHEYRQSGPAPAPDSQIDAEEQGSKDRYLGAPDDGPQPACTRRHARHRRPPGIAGRHGGEHLQPVYFERAGPADPVVS